MFQGINSQLPTADSLTEILINLLIGMILSFILSWHFIRYGRTLSNRRAFAWTFPLIALTTVLVISIVKSSLTLSLGLVGALSIVRFRTPIKEPEELAYLFMAIAIGIGLGAGQTLITASATVIILGILAIRSTATQKTTGSIFFLNIELPGKSSDPKSFSTIEQIIAQKKIKADVRRMDSRDDLLLATYYVDCRHKEDLVGLVNELRARLPQASISFVRQDNLLGI